MDTLSNATVLLMLMGMIGMMIGYDVGFSVSVHVFTLMVIELLFFYLEP